MVSAVYLSGNGGGDESCDGDGRMAAMCFVVRVGALFSARDGEKVVSI